MAQAFGWGGFAQGLTQGIQARNAIQQHDLAEQRSEREAIEAPLRLENLKMDQRKKKFEMEELERAKKLNEAPVVVDHNWSDQFPDLAAKTADFMQKNGMFIKVDEIPSTIEGQPPRKVYSTNGYGVQMMKKAMQDNIDLQKTQHEAAMLDVRNSVMKTLSEIDSLKEKADKPDIAAKIEQLTAKAKQLRATETQLYMMSPEYAKKDAESKLAVQKELEIAKSKDEAGLNPSDYKDFRAGFIKNNPNAGPDDISKAWHEQKVSESAEEARRKQEGKDESKDPWANLTDNKLLYLADSGTPEQKEIAKRIITEKAKLAAQAAGDKAGARTKAVEEIRPTKAGLIKRKSEGDPDATKLLDEMKKYDVEIAGERGASYQRYKMYAAVDSETGKGAWVSGIQLQDNPDRYRPPQTDVELKQAMTEAQQRGGNMAANINAANDLYQKNLPELLSLHSKVEKKGLLPTTRYRDINGINQWLLEKTSDPDLAELKGKVKLMADNLQKTIGGSQGGEWAFKVADSLLDPALQGPAFARRMTSHGKDLSELAKSRRNFGKNPVAGQENNSGFDIDAINEELRSRGVM